jgi:hypothetical protein
MSETQGIAVPQVTADGESRVVVDPTPGTEKYFYSPNFCDPCTWYEGATQVTEEGLTDSGDLTTWNSPNNNWIDMKHGRMFKEDDLLAADPDLAVLVEVSTDGGTNWTPKTENTWGTTDGDYTVDYDAGSVTFNSALGAGDQVRASYKKAGTFKFTVAPMANKRLKVLYAEVQFTKDLVMMGDVKFQVKAYDPNDLPNKMEVKVEVYKKAQDFFQESTGPFPVIPAFGGADRGFLSDMITIPFNYLAFRDLKSSQGLELCVCLDDGVVFTGEFCTVTFYCLSLDE